MAVAQQIFFYYTSQMTVWLFSHGRGTRKNPRFAPDPSDIIPILRDNGFTVRKINGPPDYLKLKIGINNHPEREELEALGFGTVDGEQETFENLNAILEQYQFDRGLLVIEGPRLQNRRKNSTRRSRRRSRRKSRRKSR